MCVEWAHKSRTETVPLNPTAVKQAAPQLNVVAWVTFAASFKKRIAAVPASVPSVRVRVRMRVRMRVNGTYDNPHEACF
jgi:hypothetical protein